MKETTLLDKIKKLEDENEKLKIDGGYKIKTNVSSHRLTK